MMRKERAEEIREELKVIRDSLRQVADGGEFQMKSDSDRMVYQMFGSVSREEANAIIAGMGFAFQIIQEITKPEGSRILNRTEYDLEECKPGLPRNYGNLLEVVVQRLNNCSMKFADAPDFLREQLRVHGHSSTGYWVYTGGHHIAIQLGDKRVAMIVERMM